MLQDFLCDVCRKINVTTKFLVIWTVVCRHGSLKTDQYNEEKIKVIVSPAVDKFLTSCSLKLCHVFQFLVL